MLLDTASLQRWSAEVVDHIVQCDFAAIELLVFNGSAISPSAGVITQTNGTSRQLQFALKLIF